MALPVDVHIFMSFNASFHVVHTESWGKQVKWILFELHRSFIPLFAVGNNSCHLLHILTFSITFLNYRLIVLLEWNEMNSKRDSKPCEFFVWLYENVCRYVQLKWCNYNESVYDSSRRMIQCLVHSRSIDFPLLAPISTHKIIAFFSWTQLEFIWFINRLTY